MTSKSNDVIPPRVHGRPARGLVVAVLAVGLIVPVGCLEPGQCQDLKNTRYAERRAFETCDPGVDECMILSGSGNDCSGVYSCSIAINKRFRDAAEQAVLSIVADSTVCRATCAELTCPSGSSPICDPTSRRCMLTATSVGPSSPAPLRDAGEAAPPPGPGTDDAGQP